MNVKFRAEQNIIDSPPSYDTKINAHIYLDYETQRSDYIW